MKNPPVDFLLVCSGVSLRDFELNRLNDAANLRKHIRSIEEDLRQAEAEAVFARWLMENRDDLLSIGRAQALQEVFEFMLPAAAEIPAMAPAKKAETNTAPAKRETGVGSTWSPRRRKEICA